jgi:GT2 family glycosyltransferase
VPTCRLTAPDVGPPARARAASWYVVVLSWNGREDTLAALASLRAVRDPIVHVIVVDNGSTDGTVAAVRAAYPEVTMIENGSNLGYAAGNNVGIRHAVDAGAEWVVLLNNDATLAQDALARMVDAAAAHPGAGVLAGKVFFAQPADLLWYAGADVRLRTGYSGRVRGYRERDRPEWRGVEPTGRATGAFMAVSRLAAVRAAPLEEDLFAYVEDLEWCVRIRRAGFEVLFVGDAVAWHSVSASTGGERHSTHTLYYGARNWLVTCERHAPRGPVRTALRRAVILLAFSAQALGRPGRTAQLRAVLDGWRDGRARRLGMRP